MLDNPCLIRNKDGFQLIVDIGSSQCYAQKATLITKSYRYKTHSATYHNSGGGGYLSNSWLISIGSWGSSCSSLNSRWDYLSNVSYGGESSDGYATNNSNLCRTYSTTYSANSGWTKLTNYIQEYRENF